MPELRRRRIRVSENNQVLSRLTFDLQGIEDPPLYGVYFLQYHRSKSMNRVSRLRSRTEDTVKSHTLDILGIVFHAVRGYRFGRRHVLVGTNQGRSIFTKKHILTAKAGTGSVVGQPELCPNLNHCQGELCPYVPDVQCRM